MMTVRVAWAFCMGRAEPTVVQVLSGSINLSGTVKVRVAKAYADSTVSKILDLVENAQQQKSKSETLLIIGN